MSLVPRKRLVVAASEPNDSEEGEALHARVIALRARSNTLPAELPTRAPISSARGWLLVPVIFALTALLTFVGFYLRATSINRLRSGGVPSITLPETDLSLEVQNRGDRLFVNWARQLPSLQSAKYGILSIDDGPEHHRIDLDSKELTSGSILYKPASQDVTFRLEVYRPEGPPITAIVRTLDGSTVSSPPSDANQARKEPTKGAGRSEIAPGSEIQRRREPIRASKTLNIARLPQVNAGGLQQKVIAPNAAVPPPEIALDGVQAAAPLPSSSRSSRPPDFTSSEPKMAARKPKETAQTPALGKIASPQSSVSAPSPRVPDAKASSIYVPPRPLKQVLPNTKVFGSSLVHEAGQIDVEVRIDERGRVVDAVISRNATSSGGALLTQQAIAAAKQWRFEPAKLHGKSVPSDHVIRFYFRPASP